MYLYFVILGLISFICIEQNVNPVDLICISRRLVNGLVRWFVYNADTYREINNVEFTEYFGRGFLFSYKRVFHN